MPCYPMAPIAKSGSIGWHPRDETSSVVTLSVRVTHLKSNPSPSSCRTLPLILMAVNWG
ncbi:hypothetical protein KCP74_17490 [Salmonella enterica subsp. enterica]|nr:hypothetical protein KCP74_17490 [Salmonella enterica subsp. enterica]